jgi:hypothetical protein
MVAVMAALVGAAAALEALVEPPAAEETADVLQEPARAGAWYCPATAGEGETAVLSVSAVGQEPSAVTVVRYPDGQPTVDPPVGITPGDQVDVVLDPAQAGLPVAVRWEGGPSVAVWRLEASDSTAAPCQPGPAERWYVSGLDTAGGARSVLHLFNPYAIDAVVRVTFATPEGLVQLVITDNVVVQAGRAMRLDVNAVQPEHPDLGATVEALAGRVVAAGEVTMQPTAASPGPRGRTLVPAAPAASYEWGFGYARSDDHATSWVAVTNPGSREAAVELRVSDPSPEGPALVETSIPAGGIARVDLTGASTEPEFGVSILSVNEVPVVATRFTALRTQEGREGVGASLGGASDRTWAAIGGGSGDRRGRLSLYNPGGEAVSAEVDAGEGTPSDWRELLLPPNGRAAFVLADVGAYRPSIPVRIHSQSPIVAELQSHAPDGNLRYWTALGVPSQVWRGPSARSPLSRDRSLSTTPVPSVLDDDPLLPASGP